MKNEIIYTTPTTKASEIFPALLAEYLKDRDEQKNATIFYINHGYMESWHANEKRESDNGIRRYLTALRWEQYTTGTITRDKAVAIAVSRFEKEFAKDVEKHLARLERVANAPDLTYVSVYVTFNRSRYWGYNPTVECISNNGTTSGRASGCGYDKESAAIANAFNADESILKAIYAIKESGLNAGLTDECKTACTGHNNTNICGYGAGYSVLPYFEGGVGTECFLRIFEKAGFETRSHYGKHENSYSIYKA